MEQCQTIFESILFYKLKCIFANVPLITTLTSTPISFFDISIGKGAHIWLESGWWDSSVNAVSPELTVSILLTEAKLQKIQSLKAALSKPSVGFLLKQFIPLTYFPLLFNYPHLTSSIKKGRKNAQTLLHSYHPHGPVTNSDFNYLSVLHK